MSIWGKLIGGVGGFLLGGPAGAVAGASLGGGFDNAEASRKAANTQVDSAREANATADARFQQNRADTAPWRAAGETALGQLGAGTAAGGDFNRDFTLADFNRDPGYQFRMDQGRDALESSASARGSLLGGGTLKALTRYGQDYASGEYGNARSRFINDRETRFGRLSALAGIGQTAVRDTANQGTALATQTGNNTMQAGNARASGYIGQANAMNEGIRTLGNLWQNNQGTWARPDGSTSMFRGPVGNSVSLTDGSSFE